MKLQKLLCIPDSHVPFESKAAFDLMLKAARQWQPDIVVILGDFADCKSIMSHGKTKPSQDDLKWETEQVIKRLEQVKSLGARRYVFIEGNHEYRLDRYLMERAPALFKCVSTKELLHLAELGFEYVPYKKSIKIGKVHFTHDTGSAGKNANQKAMDAFQGSAVIGHVHSMQLTVSGKADGAPLVGASFGWLGDPEEVDYLHQIQVQRNWVHGFGIGYMEPSGVIHFQPVPIVNGVCVVEGKRVTLGR